MATYPATRHGLLSNFAQSVIQNSQKILQEVNDRCYYIARELFISVVLQTPSPDHPGPTAQGLLSNNWFPVNGSGFSSETTDTKHRSGGGSLTRIKTVLIGKQFLRKDGVVTLSNNLHYAYRAEVLGWPAPPSGQWSGRIGPYRMVAKSLQKIGAKYK